MRFDANRKPLHSLGTKIKDARERLRLSGREVARRTELSASYFSKFERGLVEPSGDTALLVFLALGYSKEAALDLIINEGFIPESNIEEFRKAMSVNWRKTMLSVERIATKADCFATRTNKGEAANAE